MKVRSRALRIGFALMVLGVGGNTLGARLQDREARSRPAVTNSAVLEGVLTTGNPVTTLPGAFVSLKGAGDMALTTATGDDGRFAFRGLPAGTYRLSAAKAGYISSEFGARGPGRQGESIILGDGQSRSVQFHLLKGAVITGTVFDPFGQPLPNQYVSVLRTRMTEAGRKLVAVPVLSATLGLKGPTTDDLGRFRLYGIPPGQYLVVVGWQVGPTPPLSVTTIADVQLANQLIQNPATAMPERRPGTPGPAVLSAADRVVSIAPVYYPGTLVLTQANPVSVAAGEEAFNTDVRMVFSVSASLQVSIDTSGGPAPLNVVVQLLGNEPEVGSRWPPTGASVSSGQVQFSGIPPGRYVIEARAQSATTDRPVPRLWGAADLEIDGRLAAARVTLSQGVEVVGQVIDENGRPFSLPRRLTLRLIPDPPLPHSWRTPLSAAVEAGQFSVPDVPSGAYRVVLTDSQTSAEWQLLSARIGGQDVSDRPFEIYPGIPPARLSAVVTNRPSVLSGTLTDAQGRPVSGYHVVVFPKDPAGWYWQSRRIRAVRLGSDGAFTVRGLLTGEYALAVAGDLEPGEWYDPAVLDQLLPTSVTVSLIAGQTTYQELKIAR